jgi:hypothetical protein
MHRSWNQIIEELEELLELTELAGMQVLLVKPTRKIIYSDKP